MRTNVTILTRVILANVKVVDVHRTRPYSSRKSIEGQGIYKFSEVDLISEIQVYSLSHLSGSHVQGNQFDLGNSGLEEIEP